MVEVSGTPTSEATCYAFADISKKGRDKRWITVIRFAKKIEDYHDDYITLTRFQCTHCGTIVIHPPVL